MDAILQALDTVLSYVALIVIGLAGILLNYPQQVLGASVLTILFLSAWKINRLRRIIRWYLWFPIQRFIHRLYVPALRRAKGWLMCKAKKSVVADALDDKLFELLCNKQISSHDYRELCIAIGVAIGSSDIVPKGRTNKAVTRQRVLMNCLAMRNSLAKVPSTIPGTPEPAKPGHQTLNYLRNRNAA